jgi:hypothetical protein
MPQTIHIIFVHGTSVRALAYAESYAQIATALQGNMGANTVQTHPCLWGEHYGGWLKGGGKSIPSYNETRRPQAEPSPEEYEKLVWKVLPQDPLYELELLALRPTKPIGILPPGAKSPGQKLWDSLNALNPDVIQKIPPHFPKAALTAAHQYLINDAKIQATILKADEPLMDYRLPLARALVALSERMAFQKQLPDARLLSPEERDEFKWSLIDDALGGRQGGLFEWLRKQAGRLLGSAAANATTDLALVPHRGTLSDKATGFMADIIKYQGRGEEIRQYIKTAVTNVGAGPKILLAHSLGGIASVDLLLLDPELRKQVPLLITFGSQSPLFYEWDALVGLAYGEPLPYKDPIPFPRWINFWDPRDVLAYKSEEVFAGAKGPKDYEVDNGLPFPDSHGGYMRNANVVKIIKSAIAQL